MEAGVPQQALIVGLVLARQEPGAVLSFEGLAAECTLVIASQTHLDHCAPVDQLEYALDDLSR